MPDNFSDRLAGYVEVKDRIAVLLELFPQSRITTTYDLTREPDDKPKVICRALVYRNTDDPIPVSGTSWMYLPGSTPYTKGSEIENAETSAVGRAIGLMGILIDRSIATLTEIEGKAEPVRQPTPPPSDQPQLIGEWTETGRLAVRKTGQADGELRQSPEGALLQFLLETVDDKTVSVIVEGQLATDLYDAAEGKIADLVATVSGNLYRVPWSKGGKAMRPYQRLDLRHIKTAGWSLPAPEAASVPLFDESELDAIPL
jgi:hypothetical protein